MRVAVVHLMKDLQQIMISFFLIRLIGASYCVCATNVCVIAYVTAEFSTNMLTGDRRRKDIQIPQHSTNAQILVFLK
jgi:hypothetical protein